MMNCDITINAVGSFNVHFTIFVYFSSFVQYKGVRQRIVHAADSSAPSEDYRRNKKGHDRDQIDSSRSGD